MATTKKAASQQAGAASEPMPSPSPIAVSPRESRLGELLDASGKIISHALTLHGMSAAGVFRDAFYRLAFGGATELWRVDALWVRIATGSSPTDTRLAELRDLARDAAEKLAQAIERPSTRRCTDALTASATSLDQTSAMLDAVPR